MNVFVQTLSIVVLLVHQVRLQTVPVRDIRNLNLSFPLPDISEHFDSKVKNSFVET